MRIATYVLFMTINHTMPARSKNRPDISDIDGFTDFIYNKWKKLAKKAQLSEWSERQTDQFDSYIQKLINKMKTGEENCNRVMNKISAGIVDEETEALRRRRAAGATNAEKQAAQYVVENFDVERFRKTLMHAFHKKVNEMESRRVKQGARSSMTHWMTHIMRKFKQILDYHVKECTVDPISHENISERYRNLLDRRGELHKMGEEMIKKSKAYFERQSKKDGGLEEVISS